MKTLIGIRREDKNPWERRVPLIPAHVRELMQKYPLEIWLQPSKIRVFSDEDYLREGATIEENLSACSLILAIKEIPLHFFEREKVYIFFSHTAKGQPHNMPMLKKMMELGCTLIDYEKIVDEKGQRMLFFGRQAGQAGLVDTLWALGQRLAREGIENPFSMLKQTYHYRSLVEAKEVIEKVGWQISKSGLPPSLVPFLCGFTGYGHVSQGAQEIFDLLPFEEIRASQVRSFVRKKNFSANKVYKIVFKEEDMVKPKSSGIKFDLQDYYDNPQKYRPVLESYLPYLTILVNCIYWAPKYPKFVTKKYLKRLFAKESSLRLRVIGDISCDIEGSVECTIKATDPKNPVFVYDPLNEEVRNGFEGRGVVIMAIDNLPAEISLESSIFFSQALKPFIPDMALANFSGDFSSCHLPRPIKKGMILYRGQFTPDYEYMKNFLK